MIDIHSHIVFDVDDGPLTIDESLSLIEESYRQGVRTIVSTSHRRKGMFETPEDDIANKFLQVKREAEKLFPDLTLLYGGELYYTHDILEKLENKLVPTMNGTRFALIEFSMATPWKEIHSALSQVIMLGVTPIIAHIERYDALAFNKDRVKELINMGCYTQINSVHVLKAKLFGDKLKVFKKRAAYFLDENVVHCVASDMHNLKKRPPFMKEARRLVEKEYGVKRARALFKTNPETLINNEYL
ncbi:capsular polysaccharide biosynthesis protein Cps4B [Streptococcus pseudoporcinus]|uniref:Tyrosine-protein phosphatase n=1 Tax=Streptococcus pseudoporcinus LQ 940-04 TaxID=875093 RepID=G5KAJ4_9STRE|nr:capsular polysaccharide biosynthesis protein Cps4B [Streptococcus pseudoporcinus]EFR44516.1 PHP domain protein [Streptococcus pseudoporcinus SPIN 20026]EHI65102.1 PHP domain protein [Streptococcus pseudoporcinus LQ 940-04]VEF93076.1 protein-tyrosine-phosphatase [Streptococcus pseudoporcinus]